MRTEILVSLLFFFSVIIWKCSASCFTYDVNSDRIVIAGYPLFYFNGDIKYDIRVTDYTCLHSHVILAYTMNEQTKYIFASDILSRNDCTTGKISYLAERLQRR